jgi:hypothetical protein
MYPKCSLSDSNIFLQIVGLLSLVIIMIIAGFYYMRVCSNSIKEKYEETFTSETIEINTNTLRNIPEGEMERGDRSTFPLDKYPGRRAELINTVESPKTEADRKTTLATTNDKYTLRPCKVYFTNKENIRTCDDQSDTNPTKTCSYKFDGWQEFDTYTDKNGQTINYPKKTYEPDASNTEELINSYFTSKCFKEFSSDGQGSSQNFQHKENNLVKYDSKGEKNNTELDTNIFGGKRYTSIQFLNTSGANDNLDKVLDSICSVKYDTIPSLRGRVFYKFVLNNSKVIQDIIKVTLDTAQTKFTQIPGSNAMRGFANLGSYGLRFSNGKNDALEVFIKTASNKPANVKVYKFTYLSYLCEDSQIKISTITPLIIDANRFLTFVSSTNRDIVPVPNIDSALLGSCFSTAAAAQYQGEDGYADKIINDLRKQITDAENAISSTAKTELDNLIRERDSKQTEIDGLELQKNSYAPSDRSFHGVINLTKSGTKLFNYNQGYLNTTLLNNGLSLPSNAKVTTVSSTDICITYSTVGSYTLTVPASGYTCDVLIVGGGGGGGYDGSGGGGGGEVKYYTDSNSSFKTGGSLYFKQGEYTINVGAGGGRGPNIHVSGANGSSSSISSTNTDTNWTVCAGEHGQCACPNGVVRYGINGRYASTRDVTTSIGCNNGVFGDPTPGIVKRCECMTRTNSFISEGGGGGGSRNSYGVSGGGGGGGGGHGPEANYVGASSSGSGGKGGNPNIRYTGGGGGGGANTGNKNGADGSWKAGQGGVGVYIDINGSSVGYGGGGGGGTYIDTAKVFGTEGGGDGATQNVNTNTTGIPNTGGGGGSGGHAGISGPYGGDGGTGIVIIRIKNFLSVPSITNDTDTLYDFDPPAQPPPVISLAQNRFQTHVITAFIFLQPGYYRFKADIGENGNAVNTNISYGELMIYDESHKNNSGMYNGRKVFKYIYQSNQVRPGYLRPYIYIPKSKFFKIAYSYISYNTTNNTNFSTAGFNVKAKYSPTEPPKDDARVVNITSTPSVNSFTIGDNDKYITFHYTSDNTGQGQTQYDVNVPENFSADILVVGGGGAGGSRHGGGGGGGSVIYSANQTLNAGNYKIRVGSGGIGVATWGQGNKGSDSAILSNSNTPMFLAKGGGAGYHWSSTGNHNKDGGSGGGGGDHVGNAVSDNVPAGTKGYSGGTCTTGEEKHWGGGGGGGAGEPGKNSALVGTSDNQEAIFYEHTDYQGASSRKRIGMYNIGDMGLGNDTISSVRVPAGYKVTLYYHGNFGGPILELTQDTPNFWQWGFNDQTSGLKVEKISGRDGAVAGNGGNGIPVPITGQSIYYGGGGGGGCFSYSISPGSGGFGGGGNGSQGPVTAANGAPGTGGGGGGSGFSGGEQGRSGNGGSGIVIIRYRSFNKSTTFAPASIRLSDVTINNDDGSYSSDNIADITTPINNFILSGKQLYKDYKSTDTTIMNIFSTIKFVNNSYPDNYQSLAAYLGTDAIDYYNVAARKQEKRQKESAIVLKTAERDASLNNNEGIVKRKRLLDSILQINYNSLITLGVPTLKANFNISESPALFNDEYLTYEKIPKADLLNSQNKKNLLTEELSKFTKSIYIESLD